MDAMSLRRRALMAILNLNNNNNRVYYYKCDTCISHHPLGAGCYNELAHEICPITASVGVPQSHPMLNLTYEDTGNNYNTGYGSCPICGYYGEFRTWEWACEVACGLRWWVTVYLSCGHSIEQ